MNVIVIEDDDELGALLCRQLARDGHKATAVRTTSAAMRLSSNSPTIVVTDLSAICNADHSGRNWLTSQRPIVLTGASPTIAHRAATAINARATVSKPASTADLAAALRLQ